MSTLAYAQITNARDDAPSRTSTRDNKPGMQTYVDALAALVPAEVLTVHAVLLTFTTGTTSAAGSGGDIVVSSIILPDAVLTLKVAFWALIVICILLYALPRYLANKWDKLDWIRALIAPVAFVGWTMLQRTTAFDAVVVGLNFGAIPRMTTAIFLAVLLGLVTASLAMVADNQPPKQP